MKKTQTLSQIRAYQIVTAIVAAFFVANCVTALTLMFSLYADGNYLNWYGWYLAGQVLPALSFVSVWLFAKGTRWERLYQSALLTITTVLISGALTSVLMIVLWPIVLPGLGEALSPNILMNVLPLAVQLLVTVGAVLLLRRQAKLKNALRFVVTMLVIGLGIFFAQDIGQTMYFVASQYPDNQNLSGYMSSFIAYAVAAVILVTTYLLEKRRGAKDSFRSAVLVTTMGLIALYVGAQLVSLLLSTQSDRWVMAAVISVCSVVALVLYAWLYRTLRVLK